VYTSFHQWSWEKNNQSLVFAGAKEISTLGLRWVFLFPELGEVSFWIKKILIQGLKFVHLQQPLEKDSFNNYDEYF